MVTPITDRAAATLLTKSYGTIRNAVKRGDLTRIPAAGQVQHVAKEQVQLYMGKSQVRISTLNEQERDKWKEYRDEIVSPAIPQEKTPPLYANTLVMLNSPEIARAIHTLFQFGQAMQQNTTGSEASPQSIPFQVARR